MTYSKEAYDIDLNSLIPELNKIINSQTLSPELQISKEEYFDRLRLGANVIKEFSGYNDEPFFTVKHNEPSFDFWLAFYLSSKKPHHIELILDHYYRENGNPDLFVNRVEHHVLRIIDKNIFHNVESQLKEITSWIREKRKIHEDQKNIQFLIISINLSQINLTQTFYEAWAPENNNQDFQDNSDESSIVSLIESPYDELFFEALKIHCEGSSFPHLKKLFQKEKIQTPIILKSNFLKISLIRPIKKLIDKGSLTFNQKEAASWISENFTIRTAKGFDPFSFSSTEKRLAKVHTEPKNAQIKYEHWYKKQA